MWKRIHSNRDPRDTLYSELRKEFSGWFDKADKAGHGMASRHPKFLFGAMIILLLLSAGLSFTVFRQPAVVKAALVKQKANPVADGFGQIMQTAARIRETLRLKHLVDSLTAKKGLTAADSVLLDSALDRLGRIRKPLK